MRKGIPPDRQPAESTERNEMAKETRIMTADQIRRFKAKVDQAMHRTRDTAVRKASHRMARRIGRSESTRPAHDWLTQHLASSQYQQSKALRRRLEALRAQRQAHEAQVTAAARRIMATGRPLATLIGPVSPGSVNPSCWHSDPVDWPAKRGYRGAGRRTMRPTNTI
jgi:hypothetical protein